ncbi:hypothetical protein [Yeosuana sp. AK3]
MKVNQEQIEDLYAFTRKHFVEWYDVQTEIVDHLANGVEAQWLENPHLNFDEALKNEFKKFGIFGFSGIVEEKTNALEKYYRKEVWRYLKDYFKLPKIILTGFGVWGLYHILQLFENKNYVIMPMLIIIFTLVIFSSAKVFKQIKRNQKETGKKWLFENVIAQLGGFVHFLNFGFQVLVNSTNWKWNSISLVVFSFCIVMYMLLFYISIKVVSPKLKEKLSKEHPEYKLSLNL